MAEPEVELNETSSSSSEEVVGDAGGDRKLENSNPFVGGGGMEAMQKLESSSSSSDEDEGEEGVGEGIPSPPGGTSPPQDVELEVETSFQGMDGEGVDSNGKPEVTEETLKAPPNFGFLKGGPKRALISIILLSFFCYSLGFFFSPIANLLNSIMGNRMSPVDLGLMIAIPHLLGSLFRIPLAMLAYSNGTRFAILFSMFICTTGVMSVIVTLGATANTFEFVSHYPPLVVFGTFVGLGIAMVPVLKIHLIQWYPMDQAKQLLNYVELIAATGMMVHNFLVFPISRVAHLWAACLIWLLFMTLMLILQYFLLQNSPFHQLFEAFKKHDKNLPLSELAGKAQVLAQQLYKQDYFLQEMVFIPRKVEYLESETKPPFSVLGALTDGKVLVLGFLHFTCYGGLVGLLAWTPTYLIMNCSFSFDNSGFFAGSFALCITIGRLIYMFLPLRQYEGLMIAALLLFTVGAILLIVSSTSFEGVIIMSLSMSFAYGMFLRMFDKYISSNVIPNSLVIDTIGSFGGFLVPLILGTIAKTATFGYPMGGILFLVIAYVALMTTGFALVKYRKQKPDPLQIGFFV